MSVLAEAPPRVMPFSLPLQQATGRPHTAGGLHSGHARSLSPSSAPATSVVRGCGLPTSRAGLSLPAHAAFVASLAAPPPRSLERRTHTDAFRPIMAKDHSVVYVDRTRKHEHGYVLRPNFRQLHESDDPSSHRSLNYITSLPPALLLTASDLVSPASPLVSAKHGSKPSSAPASLSLTADRLMYVRAPRRSATELTTELARAQKEAADDFEAGGLKPRPIKSVAALLGERSLAVAAGAARKPTHLRLGSMKNLHAGAITPQGIEGSPQAGAKRLANFTRGLKLPRQSSQGPLSPTNEPHDHHGRAEFPELLLPAAASDDAYGYADGDADDDAALASGLASGEGPFSGREAVVVSAEQGSACCICTSSDFVEPWLSACGHICCAECWITWLNENPDKQCPECDAAISLEELRPIALCPICSTIPTQPWTSPCRHTCCMDCWRVWLAENPVCPDCSSPVDKALLPPS